MKELSVDTTPDKSLLGKLGTVGYTTEQAIAELVDNAIDARTGDRPGRIEIVLDDANKMIVVRDNGRGMDLDELGRAWTLGGGGGAAKGRLGRFGIGMKSATSALGGHIEIVTKREGAAEEMALVHDEKEWMRNKDASWNNVKVTSYGAKKEKHGTEVRISDLRVRVYAAQAARFHEEFGVRYGPYISDGMITIYVNGKPCESQEPKIVDGTKKTISMTSLDGIKVSGWVALLEKRSIKGNYGVHLYSQGRLIMPYAKFGIAKHPSVARFIGSVSLEHVPVNTFKTGFLTESPEYMAARNLFRMDPVVQDTIKTSAMRARQDHEVSEILNRSALYKISLPKLGEREAQRLLDDIGSGRIESDRGSHIRLESGGSGLYRIEVRDDVPEIIVNKHSHVFRAFRNPLHLLAMIQAEVETFAGRPNMDDMLQMRNLAWEKRMSRMVQVRDKTAMVRNMDLLEGALRSLCEHIVDKFKHRFQFTALSTLVEFLNQPRNSNMYTIYATKGTGNRLKDIVWDHGTYASLLDPTHRELATAFEMSGGRDIIVIREYASVPKSNVAPLDKSWIDLFFETTRRGMFYYKVELEMIESLLSLEMVKRDTIMAWAKRRKIETDVHEYLAVRHSDS